MARSDGVAFGYVCGLSMALGASVSFAAARAGIIGGLSTDDMIFARFVVAGFVMLPLLLYWGLSDLGGIGWGRGLALLLTGGPLFALLQTGGYAFAPLAHGAVIAPSTVTIVSTIGAGLMLGEVLTGVHMLGAVLVLAGIAMIAWQGIVESSGGASMWIGDALFFVSSLFWASFTLLLRHWRLDAVKATAIVAVLSSFVIVPVYFAYRGTAHLAALPLGSLIFQGAVQGLVQSIITIMAYARAVALLGVSRAVLFPAIVPALSVLIGIPTLGEVPTPLQIAGLATVSLGMIVAVGLLKSLLRKSDRTPPISASRKTV